MLDSLRIENSDRTFIAFFSLFREGCCGGLNVGVRNIIKGRRGGASCDLWALAKIQEQRANAPTIKRNSQRNIRFLFRRD